MGNYIPLFYVEAFNFPCPNPEIYNVVWTWIILTYWCPVTPWHGNASRTTGAWTSYQIRKIVGCACAGNAGNVFPASDFKRNCWLAIPTCITARASRTCRDACRDRWPAVAGENVPGIPGACATRYFTYLARGAWRFVWGIHRSQKFGMEEFRRSRWSYFDPAVNRSHIPVI